MPPDLALSSTLISSNYPCLELIFIVRKVFEPLKFDCNSVLTLKKLHKKFGIENFHNKIMMLIHGFICVFFSHQLVHLVCDVICYVILLQS